MSHKQQKNKQPHLAVANMPFTPMTHKIEKPTSTPYRLLQVNDLATPKINKSHSSVDKIEMIALQSEPQSHGEQQQPQHQEHQQEKQVTKQVTKNQKGIKKALNIDDIPTDKDNDNKNEIIDDSANDLKELKNALYTCLHVVERMEAREKEEENRRKTYKNIQVQTSPLPPKMNSRQQRKQPSNQLAENVNSSNEINPEVNYKPQKHYNNLIKASGNKPSEEKVQPLANGSIINDNGETDLQEKMKAMTFLLQKLQSRIDEIDNSSQKA